MGKRKKKESKKRKKGQKRNEEKKRKGKRRGRGKEKERRRGLDILKNCREFMKIWNRKAKKHYEENVIC